jgi:hypothetical protein
MFQGVGETLRGTLNSTIDSRFPSRNAEKAARIQAHNDSVLERGRAEMEGLPRGRYNQTQPHEPERESSIPGSWPGQGEGYDGHSIAATPSGYEGSVAPTWGLGGRDSVPDTGAGPGRTSSPDEGGMSKGIRKLFKRKPVAAGEPGSAR